MPEIEPRFRGDGSAVRESPTAYSAEGLAHSPSSPKTKSSELGQIPAAWELKSVKSTGEVVTGKALADDDENNVHLKDRLKEGKARLDEAREALRYLCEPVPPPQELEQYVHYFCGNAADPDALSNTEPLRIELYKAVATFLRAFGAIALDLTDAGYTDAQASAIRREADFFADIRAAVKKISGEELDTKPFEADMRHLLNTYVQADPADPQGKLDSFSLLELIVETGIHDAIAQKLNEQGKLSRNAIAEGIINNVRRTIIRDQLTDPRFYQQMSRLLDDHVAQSRDSADKYEEFLQKAEALARRMAQKHKAADHPPNLDGHPEALVLFNNLPGIKGATWECPADPEDRAALALALDQAMQQQAPAAWKGDQARESRVKNALYPLMGKDREATLALFDIIKNIPGYA